MLSFRRLGKTSKDKTKRWKRNIEARNSIEDNEKETDNYHGNKVHIESNIKEKAYSKNI